MKQLVLKSPAKINLYLEVINKRADGYHNIRTLFERISLCDKITLTCIPQDKIEIYCNDPDVPRDKNNLAFRAAELLKKDFFIKRGVKIRIDKHIPVASGLGGGSSNAASVLLGLNRLLNLKLSKFSLMRYGSRLGADVSFFLSQATFAIGRQKGDRIQPLAVKRKFWHVLVVCNIAVSTKEVYTGYRKDLRLTKPRFNTKMITYALDKANLSGIKPLIYNNLESVTLRKYRRIAEIIDRLKELGAIAGMSGSGSAVFGLAPNRKRAQDMAGQLKRLKGQKVFVVRTS